ncbi:MAG: ferredoxin family protein, partial [Stellaceae bacterium]
ISPEECIDCGVCEPECPAQAILPDTDPGASGEWLELNAKFSRMWPNIIHKGEPPEDADAWDGVPDKKSYLIVGSKGA